MSRKHKSLHNTSSEVGKKSYDNELFNVPLTCATHPFHWFLKRGDIDRRWEWFKKRGAGKFIRTMFFHSFDPSTTNVAIIEKLTSF